VLTNSRDLKDDEVKDFFKQFGEAP